MKLGSIINNYFILLLPESSSKTMTTSLSHIAVTMTLSYFSYNYCCLYLLSLLLKDIVLFHQVLQLIIIKTFDVLELHFFHFSQLLMILKFMTILIQISFY